MTINVRDKGFGFERKVVKILSQWTGEKHYRSPGSGALGSVLKKQDFQGDILCDNPNFLYSLECKKVEGWGLEQLLSNPKCPIWNWWQQCVNQTPEGKNPMLIFSKNHTPIYCMTRVHPEQHFTDASKIPTWMGVWCKFGMLYIYQLSDLVKTDPKRCFK